MSDYERLRRGNYHADGTQKWAQQEAAELSRANFHPDAIAKAAEQEARERMDEADEAAGLSRASFHPDAVAKAAEQEERERLEEGRVAARSPRRGSSRQPHARDASRDLADHTVMRRPTDVPRQEASGGAVVSRRSGLSLGLQRLMRGEGMAERSPRTPRQRAPRPHLPINPLVIALLVIVGLYLAICLPIDRAISLSDEEREGLSSELSWHVPGMPYYVLALGSDAREGETVSRTDTMILVRVDPLGGKLTMLSIPRDTKVEIEGYGTQKINAAYAFGGTAGAVRAVSKLTGAPISHVAVVRFDGVEQLVDYLGGVTVNVPVDVYDPEYTGLVMSAGEQQMDGATALLFSRVRHGFDLGDYQRQKNQRILIEAIMQKALALPPWELPGLVRAMGGLLGTTMRMYSILPLMARLKLGSPTIYQATVPSTTAMIDGVSYVVADDAALAQMMDVIDAGGDPATLT